MDTTDEHDPLAGAIDEALGHGWQLIPQVAHGTLDNGVWRAVDGIVDVVTLPELGPSIVVRVQGGPARGWPRRAGRQRWRHLVPVDVALRWLLSDPCDDGALAEWAGSSHAGGSQ